MKRMVVQFGKLRKLLIDRKMKIFALIELTGISAFTTSRMNQNEYMVRRFWGRSAGTELQYWRRGGNSKGGGQMNKKSRITPAVSKKNAPRIKSPKRNCPQTD